MGRAYRESEDDPARSSRKISGGRGRLRQAVPLSALGLSQEEAERVFSSFDEDYHISRYFHFQSAAGANNYQISRFPQTHISIDAEIQTIL
jgi:hypothetical protein